MALGWPSNRGRSGSGVERGHVDPRRYPIAVRLDLVNPFRPRGSFLDWLGKLGRDEFRERDVAARPTGLDGWRGRTLDDTCGNPIRKPQTAGSIERLDPSQFFGPQLQLDRGSRNGFGELLLRAPRDLCYRAKGDGFFQRIDCYIRLRRLNRGSQIVAAP